MVAAQNRVVALAGLGTTFVMSQTRNLDRNFLPQDQRRYFGLSLAETGRTQVQVHLRHLPSSW